MAKKLTAVVVNPKLVAVPGERKIYTTTTDRYAPLLQTVIACTAGEPVHTLDGLLGHDSSGDIRALSVDGGGVSDIIFAVMHLLGIAFEPLSHACRIAASTRSSLAPATGVSPRCSVSGSMPA